MEIFQMILSPVNLDLVQIGTRDSWPVRFIFPGVLSHFRTQTTGVVQVSLSLSFEIAQSLDPFVNRYISSKFIFDLKYNLKIPSPSSHVVCLTISSTSEVLKIESIECVFLAPAHASSRVLPRQKNVISATTLRPLFRKLFTRSCPHAIFLRVFGY